MAKKSQQEELMDFLKDEDAPEGATRVSFELDPFTGVVSNESEPGKEKEYIDGLKKGIEDVEVDLDPPSKTPKKKQPQPTEDEDDEEDSDVEVIEDEAPTEEESDDSEESKKQVDAKKRMEDLDRKRKSRYSERVKQLAREKKEAELKAAKLEETLNRTNAIYAKIQIDNLEKGLDTVKRELQVAVENQDAEAIATANSRYVEMYQQLKDYQKFLPDAEKASEESKSRVDNFDKNYKEEPVEGDSDMEYPEAAQLWMEGKEFIWDIAEYKKLSVDKRKKIYPIRNEMQKILENLVRKEGFTPDDPDMYEELDMRLSEKFPEYEGIASRGISALDSGVAKSKATPSGETTKPRKVEDKTRSVPVKGSSSIGSSESSSSKSTKVKLTREDYSYWEKYLQPRGITLQEYGKQVQAFENEQ